MCPPTAAAARWPTSPPVWPPASGSPASTAVTKLRSTRQQKTMQNRHQQVANLQGAFAVGEVRPGPVFLLDDMVDSRWTFTVVGSLLREAGSGPVYPVALADTSRGDQ